MAKAAIYTRVSGEKGSKENESLDFQKKIGIAWCRKQAKQCDYEVFSDVCSGRIKLDKRRAGGQLLKRIKEFDCIVVNRFDRIFRDLDDCGFKLTMFEHLGVKLVSLSEDIDTSASIGEFMMDIISTVVQCESEVR